MQYIFTGTTSNSYITPRLKADITAGAEKVTVTAVLSLIKSTSAKTYGTGTWSITINGSTSSVTKYTELALSKGYVEIITKTVELEYTEGAVNVSLSAAGGISGTSYTSTSVSGSVTVSAPYTKSTIATVTQSAEFGGIVNLTITRGEETASHRIEYTLPTGTVTHSPTALSDSLTVPITELNSLTNASQYSMQVRLVTVIDGNDVGQDTKTVTLTVPQGAKPTAPTVSITAADTLLDRIITGRSTVTLHFSGGTAQYGATIASYIVGDTTGSTGELVLPSFSAGTNSLACYAVDSRGMKSAAASVSFTAYGYTLPSVFCSAERCDSTGTADRGGSCIKITPTATFSGLGGANAVTITGKALIGTQEAQSFQLTAGTASIITGMATHNEYTISLALTDTAGNTASYSCTVPKAQRLMNLDTANNSLGIGTMAQGSGKMTVALDTELDGALTLASPLTVANGGTGATAAASARRALGATPYIDTSNVLLSVSQAGTWDYTYTATQDCLCVFSGGVQSNSYFYIRFYVNGVELVNLSGFGSMYPQTYQFPIIIKSGDTARISIANNYGNILKVYGLK